MASGKAGNTSNSYDNEITGYINQVSPVKASRNKRKRYFEFNLSTKDKNERSVCFSPEKHKLIKQLCVDEAGCEIKSFKRSDKNDILVTDFTSVKRAKLEFEKPCHNAEFMSISSIMNECPLLKVVDVKGVISFQGENCNTIDTLGKPLTYQKATLYDNIESIPITIFGELSSQITNNKCYEITNVRINKFMNQRLLKTTELTEIREQTVHDIPLQDGVLDSVTCLNGTIKKVELNSLKPQMSCPDCKSELTDEEEQSNKCFICFKCNNLLAIDDVINSHTIKFKIKSDNDLPVDVHTSKEMLEFVFQIPVSNKMELAMKMINSHIKVEFDSDQQNKILKMELLNEENNCTNSMSDDI